MKFIILALSAFSLVGFGQDIIFPLSYVKFAGETTQLTEDGLPSLDSLATFLALTGAKVEICGHTDNVGTPAEKQHLSEARAKAVCDYLRSKHVVPESNLTYKGYGPSMPVATNRTPEGRAKNNRIEIKILSPISMAGLEFIKGKILIHKPNISEPDTLSGSRDVTLYDRIITDTLGRVNLHFNRTLVKILPNSDIVIKNLNKDQKIIELHLKEGKVIVSAKEDSLSLTTPSCSLSTNHGEFVFKTERYYRDWVSVWSGSVRMSAGGSTYLVNEGNGTICYYGKKILPPRNLPESPVLDTTRQEDSLIYDGTTPMKFFCIKPAQVGVRFLLSKDPLFSDIIFETITPSESCVVSPVEIPRVYLSLSSVDESGLESRALKTYSFEISSPKMKYVPPELHITKQVIEKVGVDRYLHLEGKTEPETDLLINTVKIKTKEDGSFAIRARILPKTRAVIITAINRKGQKTEIRIPVAERRKMTLEIAGGITMLAGGGLDASKIGFILGGNTGYSINDKITIGPFADMGTIGCKTTDWEPQGEHFKTKIYLGGLQIKYLFNPYAKFSLYAGAELGAGYWKSLYDGTVYEWAINPYGGGILGIKKDLSQRFSFFFECGAGYLRNKTKPNMGTQDINYIIPKGYSGIFCKIF